MNVEDGMSPVHPSEVLRGELNEVGMSARALAKAIKVPVNRITAILNGERGITADTARRLGRYFDTSTEFWMDLQKSFEIRQAEVDDTTNQIDEIVPRETALLRDALHELASKPIVSTEVLDTLRTIECNVTLCNQLQIFERKARIGNLSDGLMRAFEAPLEEIRNAGIFETRLSEHLPNTLESLKNYESRFKSPSVLECERLEIEFVQNADKVFGPPNDILKSLDSTWLNTLDEMNSMQRLLSLNYMGRILAQSSAFSPECAESLRNLLGDWREEITWPKAIWTDFGARADFYLELGFDGGLTDVPFVAFADILDKTEIHSSPPNLIEAYLPVLKYPMDPDEERPLKRTNGAHDRLQRFESQLRRFIDCVMTSTFGSEWPSQQLAKRMVEKWQKRRQSAEAAGAPVGPLVAYANFTDYELIVLGEDNWELAFQPYFTSPEFIRESIQRLYPIRNDTMHARPITQDDELLLYVETKRVMSVIESTA